MEAKKSAYITGGAGGLGRALAARLVEQGMNVFIADRDAAGAAAAAKELGGYSAALDATSWESQSLAFQQAVDRFGRIDYVFPFAGIGENAWTPSPSQAGDKTQPFTKPNLTVIDINVNGVLYTSSIAVQQFRRQTPDEQGFRGKGKPSRSNLNTAGLRQENHPSYKFILTLFKPSHHRRVILWSLLLPWLTNLHHI